MAQDDPQSGGAEGALGYGHDRVSDAQARAWSPRGEPAKVSAAKIFRWR
jgi:hypothetical protein